jgi:hypothetical protein
MILSALWKVDVEGVHIVENNPKNIFRIAYLPANKVTSAHCGTKASPT